MHSYLPQSMCIGVSLDGKLANFITRSNTYGYMYTYMYIRATVHRTSCRRLGINCCLKNLAGKENFFYYSARVEATPFTTHRTLQVGSGNPLDGDGICWGPA